MQEVTAVLDLVKNYGVTLIIAGIAIWISVDLYLTVKKKWAPDFLESFKSIALDIKGLKESSQSLTQTLARELPKLDQILKYAEDFEVVKKYIHDNHKLTAPLENS